VEGHLEISNDQVKETKKVKEKSFKMLEKKEETAPGHNSDTLAQ